MAANGWEGTWEAAPPPPMAGCDVDGASAPAVAPAADDPGADPTGGLAAAVPLGRLFSMAANGLVPKGLPPNGLPPNGLAPKLYGLMPLFLAAPDPCIPGISGMPMPGKPGNADGVAIFIRKRGP